MDAPIEIPLCDPEVAPPWPAPGRTSLLLDQLISPTSKENLHGMSGPLDAEDERGSTLAACYNNMAHGCKSGCVVGVETVFVLVSH